MKHDSAWSEHRVRLPDGRWLGYARGGDPAGRPLLYFHGGLSCRLDVSFAAPLCAQRAISLIAVDRPGIGLSDHLPGRSLIDWAEDVKQLALELNLERFAVLGWSLGGPYALACACALPQLLTRAGTIGSAAPLNRPGAIDELALWGDRVVFTWGSRAPQVISFLLWVGSKLPAAAVKRALEKDLDSPDDRDIVSALPVQDATAFFFEALRRGVSGTLADYAAVGKDWGFRLGDISLEVTLWQGEQDTLCPMSHARYLAEHIPKSRLVIVPGRGHFLLHRELASVLDTLMA